MTTTTDAYSSYKPSGTQWLGDIPSHWEVKRLKFLFCEITEYSSRGTEDLLSVSQYTGVTNKSDASENNIISRAATLEGYKKVYEGDLVINIMLAWNGSLGFSAYSGITSPAYSVYRLKIGIKKYFHYLLRTDLYKAEFKRNSSGVVESRLRLYTEKFFGIWALFPPLAEQTAIANFLDHKTAKIDHAIAQKQKMIDLLKEQKQIIIQNAVTKGLDPKTPTKNTHIDWLGDIPSHWEVKRFRYLFTLFKGLTITKEHLQEHGIYCVNYGEIHSKYGFEINPDIHPLKCVSKEYLKSSPNSLLQNGDFIFADTSEDLEGSGNFTHLNYNGQVFAGYHTIIARAIEKINPKYLAYQFDSLNFRNQVRTKMKGVKVFSITQSILKDLFCWLPSDKEQTEIVMYLETQTAKIDHLISLHQQQIGSLKAYKHILIDHAVTGKIKIN